MADQIQLAIEGSNERWSLHRAHVPQTYLATFVPQESIYRDGVFYVEIELPNNYPLYPPRVRMTTKIFHPNFSSEGYMYAEILYSDYRPTFTLLDLMEYIYNLFNNPDPDPLSQCNATASELYINDPEKFKAIAQKWTERYAL